MATRVVYRGVWYSRWDVVYPVIHGKAPIFDLFGTFLSTIFARLDIFEV